MTFRQLCYSRKDKHFHVFAFQKIILLNLKLWGVCGMFMNDFNFIEISQTSVMHSKAQAVSATVIILDRIKANNDHYHES